MAPGSKSREADLTTASAEERTRPFDLVPAAAIGAGGPATGDVLKNRFVLHQCLADGATSRLFRAVDRRREAAGEADPWVVLKVVTAADAPTSGAREQEPRALQALRREAAIAQGLDHPNLPRILGIDQDGLHTFMCMAWLEGESLAAILDSRGARPMTRVQALQILEGAGRALEHLHARGITHADVKPGNILVTAHGEATLLDFGLAIGPGAGDLPVVRGYTREYASPDVLAGREPTASDDLFSLACVAYRMLAGQRAFGATDAREAGARRVRPTRPENLSPAQWRALDRALSFARTDRQADVETFLAEMKGIRDETAAITDLAPVEPAPLPPTAASAADRVRPQWVVPSLIVLAIGALLAGAVWLWPDESPAPSVAAAPEPRAPVDAPVAAPASETLTSATVTSPIPAPPVAPPALDPVPPPSGAAPVSDKPVTAAPRLPSAASAPAPAARREVKRQARLATVGPPAELAGPPVPESPVMSETGAATASMTPAADGLADTSAPRPVPYSSLNVRRYVEPEYPRAAASRRLAGWVDVLFEVSASGKTQNVQVIAADPPGLFDEAALSAVRRWRFGSVEPRTGEEPEPVSSQIRVRFEPR